LHFAAGRRVAKSVDVLIDECADPNVKNKDGNTPLHWAARVGDSEAVKLLIDKECVDSSVKNKDGNTPLHLAMDLFDIFRTTSEMDEGIAVIKALIDNGADPNVKNKNGDTPLHMAADLRNPIGRIAKVGKVLRTAEMVEVLTNKCADPNARNKSGRTPLHSAAGNDNAEMVKALIDNCADPKAEAGFFGRTPRDIAESKGNEEIVEILRRAGG